MSVVFSPAPSVLGNDAWHRQAAAHGSEKLLRRQIEAGQVFPVTMTIWQARHGVAS